MQIVPLAIGAIRAREPQLRRFGERAGRPAYVLGKRPKLFDDLLSVARMDGAVVITVYDQRGHECDATRGILCGLTSHRAA